MRIRNVTKKDLKEISDIFRIESAKKPYNQKWTKKTSFEKIIKSFNENDIYVAIIKDKLAGFIIFSRHPNNKKKAYIDELWLKIKYQGMGIGQNLVKFIENKYMKKGVRIMQVVSNKNSSAFKFYKKLDYEISKELAFMEKKLK